MSRRYHCAMSGMQQGKDFAGTPYTMGATFHCAGCGQELVITNVLPTGVTRIPEHNYPTKAELRARRKAANRRP